MIEDEYNDLPSILTFTDIINIADDDGFNDVYMNSYGNSPTGTGANTNSNTNETATNGSKHQSKSSKRHKHKSKSTKSGSARGSISETSAVSPQRVQELESQAKTDLSKRITKELSNLLGKGKTFDKGRHTKIGTKTTGNIEKRDRY